jgi:SAM-dependent methyltransferase
MGKPDIPTDHHGLGRCRLCGGAVAPTGHASGDRPNLPVGKCNDCGLIQLMNFDHVCLDHYRDDCYFPEDLATAYAREAHWNINRIERIKTELPDHRRRRALDFGCGVGGFLLRAGPEFEYLVGFDLSARMSESHRDSGANCVSCLDDVPSDIDTLILFHVLEHVIDPWDLLANLVQRFMAVDRVVVEVPNGAELLIESFELPPYKETHFSSDHLYYFTNRTLGMVMEKAGLRVLVDTQLQRYTLGNTLGWLAEGKGGGQNRRPLFNGAEFHRAYESALAEAGLADSVLMICEPLRGHGN